MCPRIDSLTYPVLTINSLEHLLAKGFPLSSLFLGRDGVEVVFCSPLCKNNTANQICWQNFLAIKIDAFQFMLRNLLAS